MPRRIALILAIVASLSFFPMRLSAQQKYVGLSLCSTEFHSSRSRFGIRLDRTQHGYRDLQLFRAEIPFQAILMLYLWAVLKIGQPRLRAGLAHLFVEMKIKRNLV